MDDQATPPRIIKSRRRRHPKAFKDRVLAECQQPGVSVASVALRHGINQNLVYKWRHQISRKANDTFLRLPTPVAMPVPMDADSSAKPATVRIDLPMSSGQMTVHWPLDHIKHSTAWFKALMQ
jgi:transposase